MLGKWKDQTIQLHGFTPQASSGGQSRTLQNLTEPQPLPHLMAHVYGPRLAGFFRLDVVGIDEERSAEGSRLRC
jgi:hypothetical protein